MAEDYPYAPTGYARGSQTDLGWDERAVMSDIMETEEEYWNV